MQYITTTELRTQSSRVVKTLKNGERVRLVHRSRLLGEIQPMQEPKPLTKEGIEQIKKLAEKLNLPKLSYKERERRYRKHLIEKYGKNLS